MIMFHFGKETKHSHPDNLSKKIFLFQSLDIKNILVVSFSFCFVEKELEQILIYINISNFIFMSCINMNVFLTDGKVAED